ncbi:MAG: MFS transporter, partial [Candidatus Saccharimonadales bacterium]
EWDWLGDPFWRAQTLIVVAIVSLVAAVTWELRRRDPVVDLRPLSERNFALSAITVFAAFGALYGALTSLPAMLEVLFGYDATHAGLVMSPAGVFSLMMMPIVGYLLGRQFDARWLVLIGALVMAAGFYWMSRLNLEVSPSQIVWPRVVQAVGTSILFAPLNVAAYMYLPRELRAPAVGLYNLLRNEGGSVGTSLAKTLVERRQQLHLWRLDDELTPFNGNVQEALTGIQNFFVGQTGDAAGSQMRAWQVIDNLRQEQALSLSYFDCFWFFAVVSLVLVPLALAMRRSVAEKGAHLGAE